MSKAARGEIWEVEFRPAVGAEIRKMRPAVVVNVPEVGRLPLRIVVPSPSGSLCSSSSRGLFNCRQPLKTVWPKYLVPTLFKSSQFRKIALCADLDRLRPRKSNKLRRPLRCAWDIDAD